MTTLIALVGLTAVNFEYKPAGHLPAPYSIAGSWYPTTVR